jgi:hypothetical protein
MHPRNTAIQVRDRRIIADGFENRLEVYASSH